MDGAKVENSNLEGSHLSKVKLSNSVIKGSNLKNVKFEKINFWYADIDSNIKEVEFIDTDLSDAIID